MRDGDWKITKELTTKTYPRSIRIHLEVDHKRKIDSETNKERHMRRI